MALKTLATHGLHPDDPILPDGYKALEFYRKNGFVHRHARWLAAIIDPDHAPNTETGWPDGAGPYVAPA